jgi:hypothetical protein
MICFESLKNKNPTKDNFQKDEYIPKTLSGRNRTNKSKIR